MAAAVAARATVCPQAMIHLDRRRHLALCEGAGHPSCALDCCRRPDDRTPLLLSPSNRLSRRHADLLQRREERISLVDFPDIDVGLPPRQKVIVHGTPFKLQVTHLRCAPRPAPDAAAAAAPFAAIQGLQGCHHPSKSARRPFHLRSSRRSRRIAAQCLG